MKILSYSLFPPSSALKRTWLVLSLLLGLSGAAHASSYYWVPAVPSGGGATTGTGTWTELTHWASSSGGAGSAYTNVPKSTDNVFFDDNSFNGNNQRITISGTVTCLNMTWSGSVKGATLVAGTGAALEINGDLHYVNTMSLTTFIGVPHRLLATGSAVVDTQGVPFNASLTFTSTTGNWTFTSPFSGQSNNAILTLTAGSVSFGSTTLTLGQLAVTGSSTATLDLGSSTVTMLAIPGTWNLSNPNLTVTSGLNGNTSTINLGAATVVSTYSSPFAFTATKAFAFDNVVVTTASGALFAVAGSSFKSLLVNSRATITSPAAISANGSLTLGPDAALAAQAGQVLSFGSGARLLTSGSCAGLGTVQSTQTGSSVAGNPAILARTGGWASAPISYAVLQDLLFTDGSSGNPANGAAVATASADQGGNSGVTISGLPVTDLYWVGGTGNWHDASHWASTSGGTATSTTCVPNVFTNVHFDANSFSNLALGRVVTLDLTGQSCRNMDWTGVLNTPALVTPTISSTATPPVVTPTRRALTVAGSLTLVAGMTQSLPIDLFLGLPQGGGSYTLTTNGQALAATLWFRPTGGSYTLQDDLNTTGRLFVETGIFNSSNRTITAQSFTSGYGFNYTQYATGTATTNSTSAPVSSPISLSPPTVNLGTSTVNLFGTTLRSDLNVAIANFTWDVASTAPGNAIANLTLNAANSTIKLLLGSNNALNGGIFRGGLGLSYGTVSFDNNTTGTTASIVVVGTTPGSSTFKNLTFNGSAVIGSSNTISTQLQLTPGKAYSFGNTTQTFSTGAALNAVGTCSNFITITGTSTGVLGRFVAPANVPLQYVALQYTNFSGGANWQDLNGADNGSNAGITITPPVARRLYWVGNSGSWSQSEHWALSSGGASGNCGPSFVDEVVVDANSYTSATPTSPWTLTIDVAAATCKSIDCSAATNNLTLSSVSGNQLSVYGSVAWASASPANMTLALAGGLAIVGTNTSSTITSNGQTLGSTLTINTTGGTVALGDDFLSSSTITQATGTLSTNGNKVSVTGFTTTGNANKVLNLGASTVIVNGSSWNMGTPTNNGFTINPGTSNINLTNVNFTGGNQAYYNVSLNSTSTTLTVSGNNTFNNLQPIVSTNITGSNTINGTLTFTAGRTYIFTTATTTTFGSSASLVSVGTSSSPVTLQSSANGTTFTWTKASGGICADYTYIRDSKATGGAYFEAGRNGANNQGNNPGWSFGFVPRAAYVGRTTCPAEGAHTLRFDFTAYDGTTNVSGLALATAQFPLTMRVTNTSVTPNTYEDVSVSGTPYYYPIANSTATTKYQVTSLATSTSNGCGSISNTDLNTFPVVTDAILAGTAGTWSGNTSTDWTDCHNWANGTVPDLTTDATVSKNTTSVGLGNSQSVAVPVQPTLNTAGAQVRTLTIPTGATLALGSGGQLAVAGNWVNNGTVVPDAASQVTFQGSSAQTLTNGNFGGVVVNNAAGLTLASDASTSGTLTLTSGKITTGTTYKWVHSNTSATSLSGYSATSYVVGNLRRTVASGATGTYGFPVGRASQYALLELVDHNLTGTSTLDAKFGDKPGTDTGLNCREGSRTYPYTSVNSAGVWTLTPSAQPTAGTYDAKVSLAPFSNLVDNYFGILKRADVSTSAADWSTGGGTLNPDNGAGRRVADGYALRLGLSSFSQFGLGQTQAGSPLPVTLVSFAATASGACSAHLTWTSASETNSNRYEVERSIDGQSFVLVSPVPSRNSASGATYTYLDLTPGAGTTYYRLRLVDLDGSSTYSPVVALASACPGTGLALVPNPATSSVRVLGLHPGQYLRVYASDGRLLYTGTEPTLEVSAWATGLYLVYLLNADGSPAGSQKLLRQ
ncbi:MAG: hypothetical protein ACRYFX_28485 [Janthinobacterium lividum]